MPTLKVPDGEIHYEVHGSGYPLMIFAPGGLRSELAFWRHSPSDPVGAGSLDGSDGRPGEQVPGRGDADGDDR